MSSELGVFSPVSLAAALTVFSTSSGSRISGVRGPVTSSSASASASSLESELMVEEVPVLAIFFSALLFAILRASEAIF